MWIRTLRVEHFRCFASAAVGFEPRTNLLLGPNGAGKTSLLEAAYLLSHGRSFRPGGREALLARAAPQFQVYAEVERADGTLRRLGLARGPQGWTARRDGAPVARLSELLPECAVVCFEPGSHALIHGPASERREFLDWGVFHVERSFLEQWRRFQRALKQRNQALRDRGTDAALEAWTPELARAGTAITTMRTAYLARFEPFFARFAAALLPELGEPTLRFDPGFEGELEAALGARRARDRQRQTTTAGPHRADWRPAFAQAPLREHLSRGQEKLTALAVVLAQAECFRVDTGEWPVLALDDLPSELDASHLDAVLALVRAAGAQSLLTATTPEALAARLSHATEFHVEHNGVVRRR